MNFKYTGDAPVVYPFLQDGEGFPLSVAPGDVHEFHKAPNTDWERVEATPERAPARKKEAESA